MKKSDLGADIVACKKCGIESVLMFNLCKKCRPDGLGRIESYTYKEMESIYEFLEECDNKRNLKKETK